MEQLSPGDEEYSNLSGSGPVGVSMLQVCIQGARQYLSWLQ